MNAGLLFLRPYAARRTMTTAATARTATAYVHLYQTVCSLRRRPQVAAARPPPPPHCLMSTQASGENAATSGRRRSRKQRREAVAAAVVGNGNGENPLADDTEATTEDRSPVALRIRELDAAGARVYPRYVPQAERLSVGAFRARFDDVGNDTPPPPRVELSGRVLSVHRLGAKLFFVRLLDEGAQVQVMCNLRTAGVDAPSFKTAARLLQRGDHVAVTGHAVRTDAGELTLAADALPRVYAPALAPLPQLPQGQGQGHFHRSTALLVQPGAAATLRLRARLLQALRTFLEERRFVEVQTPVLAARAGGATARPFVTRRHEDDGELSLRIAPELWLKRLVVGGLDRVYEIGPAFRNEGIDTTHNPEFTMCEFYAAYWTLERLMAETERLVGAMAAAADAFRIEAADAGMDGLSSLPSLPLSTTPEALDMAAPFARVAFVPGLEAALGFALPNLDAADAYGQLRKQLIDAGHEAEAGPDDGDLPGLLDRLAGQYLENQAQAHPVKPLFVTHHPACLSPLAKSFVCAQTGQRVAARAELFAGGRELANMYEEENDPAAQRAKMAAAGQAGQAGQAGGEAESETEAVDEHYLAALETGLPPTGGWGCGVERLVMLFSGQRRIADCLSFGTLRHVVAAGRGRG